MARTGFEKKEVSCGRDASSSTMRGGGTNDLDDVELELGVFLEFGVRLCTQNNVDEEGRVSN